MTQKEILKRYLKRFPLDKRLALENIIDGLSDENVNQSIKYFEEVNKKVNGKNSHSITNIGYNETGVFEIVLETGTSWITLKKH